MRPWIKQQFNLAARSAREFTRRLALLLLNLYQLCLSPWLGGRCRFEPSCSHYAIHAFKHHSPARALWLTVRRLIKCQPLGPYGFDPVPERKSS